MKRLILLLSFAVLLCGFLQGAIFEHYLFSQGTTTYTPITGTAITDILGDDMLSGAINIGFTFPYGMDAFTQVKVSSNGWIGLGTAAPHSNLSNQLSGTTDFPYIAPVWDDNSLSGGGCQYLTSGTAPNRTFVVQYENLQWNYWSGNQHNFQVWFYENGKIEFVYGTSSAAPSNASASIGINMVPGGANNYYSVTPGTPATASYTTENTSVATWPGNGTKYIFDVVAPAPNDMAALSITGNMTPTQGSASNYTISVRNSGTNAQSNYSVRIMMGTDVLASVAGPAINAGAVQNVVVPWTPQVAGAVTIHGNVLLAGDEYPQNNNTQPLNVIVQAVGTVALTIGTGGELANIPVNMFWMNSLFETIYQADEMTMAGLITGVSFYNNFVTDLPNKPTKIWLGTTTQTDLSGGWIPATQLTLVYDGTVNYPSGQNMIMIPFATPFIFGGGNLVMMVNRPMDTTYFNSQDVFDCQTVGTNRSLEIHADGTEYFPNNPPAGQGTLSGQFPRTTFYFTAGGTNPQFGVAPESKNFGTVLINSVNNQPFTVVNIGGGTLTVNSITISGSPFFGLSNLPALPVTLGSMQSFGFTGSYLPTAAGPHTGTITITDNLTRTIHTVPLTGNCVDPNIYTSPYVQNFDEVNTPNIPVDWNRLVTPGLNASVTTVTNNPFSQPNCIMLYNGSGNTADVILISPPLAPALILNDMRIKFRARGLSTSTLQVGIIADIADAATFTSLSTVNTGTVWTEHIISLAAYTGTGRYVAIKHGNTNGWEQIFVDNVTIELLPQNDLSALSVSGNTTPSVGTASNYTVTIYNWGTNPQSNYQVKLFREGDIEVASVAGTMINPGAEATFTLSWTPSVAGVTYIYGKTALTGDQNTFNDSSPNFGVIVQQQGTTAITIGDGNQLANIPVNFYWRNSLFETIFQASDIPAGGQITSIAFYNNFITNLPNMPTKIWLGMTNLNELTGGWIPATDLTLVFDGTVNYPSGSNTITIPLATPFPYAGTNLVMMVNRPMDTTYYSSSDRFQAQTGTLNNSLTIYSDGTTYDPNNPPDGAYLSGQFPKTTLFFAPTGPDPLFGVAPASKNFGTVLMNSTNTQVFTMYNSGGAPLTVNTIVLDGSPMYNLQNLPALPITLNSGQNASFTLRYQPTAAGAHAAAISITDNLGRSRTEHIVPLQGTAVDATIYTSPYFQNFDTAAVPYLPIDWQKIVQPAGTNGVVQTSTGLPYSTPNSIYMYNMESTTSNLILIAPPLVSTLPVTSMRTKFWARGSTGFLLQVGVISDVTDPATFQAIQTINLTNEYAEYVVGFQTYTGAGQNIAFRHGQGGTYQSIYIDNVTIETTPQNDLAALAISGNTTPSVGMTSNYNVTVFNWGTNPQDDYTVKLFGEGDIEIASVDGPTIAPGTSANVQLSWAPATQGLTFIYGKVVMAGDQNNLNDQTPNLNVSVQAAGTMVVTVGDGAELARMPMDMYYMNSLFETVFLSTELNFIGMITGISFYSNFSSTLMNMPTNIWLGTTTQSNLENDWIPSTQMTAVFSGNVNFPSGQNLITMTFPQPFLYLEGNLVMMVERPMDTQYYSSMDQFYCQTVGTNRSRNAWSDWNDYDPALPPTDEGMLTGQFPKTSFLVIPGGVGHLTGTVLGAGNQPLNNVNVGIVGGAQVTTNAQGNYLIQNIIAGDYQVSASRYGYIAQTVNVTIPEDSTVVQNFTLQQMPTVSVTGTIVGSDAPTIGLSGATIQLTGYENYQATTNAQGIFTIPGVYANQTYQYIASSLGYQVLNGTINVGATNHNMGTVTLSEIAYTPRNVNATVVTEPASVNVTWLAPDPGVVDVDQSFESATFPPTDWTRTITNNGPPNTVGVYPTWCRVGAITSGTTTITPTDGLWQAGFWWDYNHQDEWLKSPAFNCPQGASLTFDTYCFYGSMNGDHYYVKITNNNGNTWNVLWDASTLTGGWNAYQTPVTINLADYTGQQIKLAWHAQDPPSNDGMWYNWFIDNIQVSNTTTTMRLLLESLTMQSASKNKEIPQPAFTTAPLSKANDSVSLNPSVSRIAAEARTSRERTRSLQGYKVWRLLNGQEQNEQTWTLLTPQMITALNYSDTGTPALPAGTYKWAVKAIYTNDVFSLAAFSNPITIGTQSVGTLTGVVRTSANIPIMGATVSAGSFNATTNASGVYSMQVSVGTYAVTCTAAGFNPMTNENIVITENQTTVCNFVMSTGIETEVEIVKTELKGNYPNPFNPETIISYDIKGQQPVRIEIYNTKGQLIRTLVNELKNNGHHTAVWNGRDDHGKSVASGIYHYRMQAGDYKANRRMMLLK
jgi:hypothetical protein